MDFFAPVLIWLNDRSWFGDTTLQWLMALTVSSTVTVSLGWVNRFLHSRLALIAPTTQAVIDDLLLEATGRTKLFFRLAAGVWAGLSLVTLPEPVDTGVHNTLIVLIVVQVGLWLSGLVHHLVEVLLERHAPDEDLAHKTGRNILRTTGSSLVWIMAFLLCLHNIGINVSALVTTLGVLGVAASLSVQKIGSDVIASACILMDRPFLVGDFLIVDGIKGTVERIGIRTTHLRSLDGEHIVFTNSDLSNARVRNYKTMFERRMPFEFAVRHDIGAGAMAQLMQAIAALITAHPRARFDRAHWHGFGTHAFLIEVVFFAQSNDLNVAMDVQQEIFLKLLDHLEQQKIPLAVGTALRTCADQALVPHARTSSAVGFSAS